MQSPSTARLYFKSPKEHENFRMYPAHNNNKPFIADDECVSPLSPPQQTTSWYSDSSFREAEHGNQVSWHAHTPYGTEDVENPPHSFEFSRVDWESQRRSRHELSRSRTPPAEDFRLPSFRTDNDGLGIHITDDVREVDFSPTPSVRGLTFSSSITKRYHGKLSFQHLHNNQTQGPNLRTSYLKNSSRNLTHH
jgi:hypothetical protein